MIHSLKPPCSVLPYLTRFLETLAHSFQTNKIHLFLPQKEQPILRTRTTNCKAIWMIWEGKMQRLCSPSVLLLLCCCLSGSQANRVYVHPFYLFASENVSCETLQSQTAKPLATLPVAPLNNDDLTPDIRDSADRDGPRPNVTQRTAVLAELLNSLGLRMYQALSAEQRGANTLLSPANTYGSLVTFYLGASIKTASSYQVLAFVRNSFEASGGRALS